MENITTDLLLTIYKRALEYSKALIGTEADNVSITEDGNIYLTWYNYSGCDDDTLEISPDKLTADLDAVYAERKQKEAEAERLRKIEQDKQNAARLIREKNERRQQYLKLKQEFE